MWWSFRRCASCHASPTKQKRRPGLASSRRFNPFGKDILVSLQYSIGGRVSTKTKVIGQYRQHGAMTIGECAQRLGVYPEKVRPHVKPPAFESVGSKRMGSKMVWATVWRLTREGLYVNEYQ